MAMPPYSTRRVRTAGARCLIAAVLLLAPALAAAQTLVPQTSSLVQETEEAPRPGQSGVSATLGLELQSGRTDSRGWKADVSAAHTTDSNNLIRFDFKSKYGSYRASGASDYTPIDDNQLAELTDVKPLPHRLALLTKASWRRDKVLDLTYRAEGEGGLGVTIIDTKRVYLLAGVSFSVGRKSYGGGVGSSAVRDVGALSVFTFHVTPTLTASWLLDVKKNVSSSNDSTNNLSASVVAQIARHLGLKVYYERQFDSIHNPLASATQSVFGVGLQVSFGAKVKVAK